MAAADQLKMNHPAAKANNRKAQQSQSQQQQNKSTVPAGIELLRTKFVEKFPEWQLLTSNVLDRMCCFSESSVLNQDVVDHEMEHEYMTEYDETVHRMMEEPTLVSSRGLQEQASSWMISSAVEPHHSTSFTSLTANASSSSRDLTWSDAHKEIHQSSTFYFLDTHDDDNDDEREEQRRRQVQERRDSSHHSDNNRKSNTTATNITKGRSGGSSGKTKKKSIRQTPSCDRSSSGTTVTTANESWSSFPSLEPCYTSFWNEKENKRNAAHQQQQHRHHSNNNNNNPAAPCEVVVPTSSSHHKSKKHSESASKNHKKQQQQAHNPTHVRRWSNINKEGDLPAELFRDGLVIRQVQSESLAELPYLTKTAGYQC